LYLLFTFRGLKWKVHPPTAYSFVKHIMVLIPIPSVTLHMRHDILELSRFLTELSVIDYFFVAHRPSDVALAAMLNAMERLPGLQDGMVQAFVQDLTTRTCLEANRSQILECRQRLRLLYAQGGYSQGVSEVSAAYDCRNESISPVCVSYGVRPQELRNYGADCSDSDLNFCQNSLAP
jgi:Cyclin, C-terminal domain